MPDSGDGQSPAVAQVANDGEDAEEVEQRREEQSGDVDMDISNSPIQVHHREERREEVNYEVIGGQWGAGCSTWRQAEARPQADVMYMEESRSNFNFAGVSNEALRLKSQRDFSGAGEWRSQEFSTDHFKNVINSDHPMKQVVHSVSDGKHMEFKSAASEKGTHVMSHDTETNDPNKRPGIICDFYAKGWCIRGSSCRFIHAKDTPNNSHQKSEGDTAAARSSKQGKVDEGKSVIPERSALLGSHDLLASSSGYSFPLPSHLGVPGRLQFQVVHEEPNVGYSSDVPKLHLEKDDLAFLTSYKDGLIRNQPSDDYNNSPNKKGRYSTENASSHSSSMEDLAGVWRQHDHSLSLVRHSLNRSSNTVIANGLLPSSHKTNWAGLSLPASYPHLDEHPVGPRKLLVSEKDYHAYTRPSAFLKSSSPFASSELNTISPHSAEPKTKNSSNNWEPSVPFRPSCILPSAFLSFSAQQYEPLELPKLVKNSLEASFYSEGVTAGKRLQQKVLPETVRGTRPRACDTDSNSVSSGNAYHEKVLDNSCYIRDPNSPVAEAETVGASVVYQNGTLTKDENPVGHSEVRGSTNPNKVHIPDSRHQSDGSSSHQRAIKVDKFREHSKADREHTTDGDAQQESKEMRHFRCALIKLVKELLKPKWGDGTLSKDAHNKIVKKAVDKILSAFQPQQIPATPEAVTQYLSECRAKISKLVEGYIVRHVKP